MPLTFFHDQPEARSSLTQFARQSRQEAVLLTDGGASSWNGILPSRVGDDFYGTRWILYSGATELAAPDLSAFSADQAKSARQAALALADLARSMDWAIFPWGGYAGYGMLGLITRAQVDTHFVSQRIFQYASVESLDQSYHGLIGRRNRSPFARSLWDAIGGQSSPPLIVTFEFYEDAFVGAKLAFSVEGSLPEPSGQPKVSVYRIRDYETFDYFVKMANQVSVFDVLPGALELESCADVRRLVSEFNLAGALQHAPWFLIYNGGEIDTNNVLFAASEHSVAAHFVGKATAALDFVSYF